MSDDILRYYNEELDYVRRAGSEFAKLHPKVSGSLHLDQNAYEDPLVARLVESFAFLTAKMRRQLDGDYTELAQSLLNIIYPAALLPVPSLSTLQFSPSDQLATQQTIARDTELETMTEEICQFRTSYPVTLWPLMIKSAKLRRNADLTFDAAITGKAKACIRLNLSTTHSDYQLADNPPDQLRLYLNVQKQYANQLYEYLFHHVTHIVLRAKDQDKFVKIAADALQPVGFAADENLMPTPKQTPAGFSLLTEYSVFADKFMYIDITGLKAGLASLQSNNVEILLFVDQYTRDLDTAIHDQTFLLGCTPIINLFEATSDPLRVNHQHAAYHLPVDKRESVNSTEIFQVTGVHGWHESGEALTFRSLYGLHYGEQAGANHIGWEALKKPAWQFGHTQVSGDEVMLRFIGEQISTIEAPPWTVHADLLCLNRDLPSHLPFGGGEPGFKMKTGNPDLYQMQCLRQPTAVVRPDKEHKNIWHVFTAIASAHDSLLDPETNLASLKRILSTLNTARSSELDFMIEQIRSITPKRISARYPHADVLTFVQGIHLTIEFNELNQSSADLYLFGSVLSRFLNEFCALNSFIQLSFQIKNQGTIATWQPQFGQQKLV